MVATRDVANDISTLYPLELLSIYPRHWVAARKSRLLFAATNPLSSGAINKNQMNYVKSVRCIVFIHLHMASNFLKSMRVLSRLPNASGNVAWNWFFLQQIRFSLEFLQYGSIYTSGSHLYSKCVCNVLDIMNNLLFYANHKMFVNISTPNLIEFNSISIDRRTLFSL